MWPLVTYETNTWASSETGYDALRLIFGSQSEIYSKLQVDAQPATRMHVYVKLLDENLRLLHDLSRK